MLWRPRRASRACSTASRTRPFRRGGDPARWNALYPYVYPQLLAKAVLAAILVGALVFAATARDPIVGTLRAFAAALVLHATVYPWYVVWVLPWAALRAAWPWQVLSYTVLFSYLPRALGIASYPGGVSARVGAVRDRRRGLGATTPERRRAPPTESFHDERVERESESSESVARARYAVVLSYRGTHHAGWQRQPRARTLQQTLEEALSEVLGSPAIAVASGRTDAGVHARGQVAHFDARPDFPCRAIVLGTNAILPDELRVHWAGRMSAAFHARKGTAGKEYRYRVGSGPAIDALELPYRVPLPRDVDLGRVRLALPVLIGEHDFSAFASSGGAHHQARRRLYDVQLRGRGGRFELRFEGSGFLRGMVRALVGTLFEVGRGRLSIEGLRTLLRGAPRSRAGASAPARGLVLERVWYPRDCVALESYPESQRSRLLRSFRAASSP